MNAIDPEARAVSALLAATPVLVGVASRAVEQLGAEVSLAQFRLLLAIAEGGGDASTALAARLGAVPSSVTRLADRLEDAGYLVRHRERPNRSVVRLELTDAGHALVERTLARRAEELAALVRRLPAGAAEPVAVALEAVVAAADVHAGDGPIELRVR